MNELNATERIDVCCKNQYNRIQWKVIMKKKKHNLHFIKIKFDIELLDSAKIVKHLHIILFPINEK